MEPGKVLVYTDARREGATYQIRIADPLHAAGIEIIPDEALEGTSIPRMMQGELDAVIVHRGIRKRCPRYASLLKAARCAEVPVIYDVDDLLLEVPRDHPDFPVYQARALGALKVLLDADLVVTSTPALADHLHAFHPHVTVIPNRLPASIWSEVWSHGGDAGKRGVDDPLVIGYIGTHTHAPDLKSIEPALLAVLDRFPGRVRFLAVGLSLSWQLRSHRSAEMQMPPRESQKEYAVFARYAASLPIDIGIAPLLDTPFNRCKSDIKFQEYTALGVPGVYSDVLPYRDAIGDQGTGLLAAEPSDWIAHLTSLCASPQRRVELARAARQHVMRRLTSAADHPAWPQVIEQARQLAADPAARRLRSHAASVMDHLFAYQADLERQLKLTVEFQVGKTVQRLLRKVR